MKRHLILTSLCLMTGVLLVACDEKNENEASKPVAQQVTEPVKTAEANIPAAPPMAMVVAPEVVCKELVGAYAAKDENKIILLSTEDTAATLANAELKDHIEKILRQASCLTEARIEGGKAMVDASSENVTYHLVFVKTVDEWKFDTAAFAISNPVPEKKAKSAKEKSKGKHKKHRH